ncbi:aspartyl-phosphate phosphatase Spo0E family protein [Niallia sp. NCCP-28]|uniref:aspartyl-phosphate phosphatase Spo0E family protein n=1 Tax=Niallia sp. NCCP-28 TaxID=2934712 RepID=UPI00208BE721|nr:aspartyl-phosphate phosphatase Spo0E family protein [Niallia sp. NCCP-28]GKU83241.1 hypothetical protein NCCP28_26370 [Niallia sp. NCCP-28]
MTVPLDNREANNLLVHIQRLRKELIEIGLQEGFQSTNTIQISQTLDNYIVSYQKMILTCGKDLHTGIRKSC